MKHTNPSIISLHLRRALAHELLSVRGIYANMIRHGVDATYCRRERQHEAKHVRMVICTAQTYILDDDMDKRHAAANKRLARRSARMAKQIAGFRQ